MLSVAIVLFILVIDDGSLNESPGQPSFFHHAFLVLDYGFYISRVMVLPVRVVMKITFLLSREVQFVSVMKNKLCP